MKSDIFERAKNKFLRAAWRPPKNFNRDKKDLIDYTFRRCNPVPVSFADLGGVWNVDGAYTFYAICQYGPRRAVLVDTDFTDSVKARGKSHSALTLVLGNFGDESVAQQVGKVDAIFLFDVLLHQVRPDWDQILAMYADRTRYFVIFNQQWTGDKTVRLLDLGREEYFKNVPHDRDHPVYKALFEKLHEMHPQHNRLWRDVHNVWQWGITDSDLMAVMNRLGYEIKYYKHCGRFGSLPNCQNRAFVFQRV